MLRQILIIIGSILSGSFILYLSLPSLPPVTFSSQLAWFKHKSMASAQHTQSNLLATLSDWPSAARPHPHPHAFNPTLSALSLAVLRNAPTETEGFTLALFHPSSAGSSPSALESQSPIAVTHNGRVLLITEETLAAFQALAEQSRALPDTNNFRNAWVIKQPRTSQPIDRIVTFPVLSSSGHAKMDNAKEISVQGYSASNRELKEPVGEFTQLPESLYELVGLALKAREGENGDDQRRDGVVLSKVRGLLDRWY